MHGSRRDNKYFIKDGQRYYLLQTDNKNTLEVELISVDKFRDEVETAMIN